MLTAVKGYYEDGQIFFKEPLPVIERTDVIVIFLMEEKVREQRKRKLGLLEGRIIVPDDFDEPLDELKDYM